MRSLSAWLRGEFARLKLRQMWSLAGLLVLAVTALFGGLDTVDQTIRFDPGEEFSDGQFGVTVRRATLVEDVRAGGRVLIKAKPGRRYLGVSTTISNDGTTPGWLHDELELRGVPHRSRPSMWRPADGSPLESLGPGLREQVVFIWDVPRDALRPGDTVTLRVWQKKFTELLVTYGRNWVASPRDYGQITLAVGTP